MLTTKINLTLCQHCNSREKTKPKDGKVGHKERRARKQTEANSSKKPKGSEDTVGFSDMESNEPADTRGPTIPRNTGQRYAAIVSPRAAEPTHHITFSSQNKV